jgi:mannose-6-phosphate isomerase-like protein (cupin superfamily)
MIAPMLAGNVLGSDAGNFIIAEWRDAGGSPTERRLIAPRHLHRSDDEAWYVLEGTLMFEIGDDEIEARGQRSAGSGRCQAHLLESFGGACAVCHRHDAQNPSTDQSDPRDAGAVPRGACRSLRSARFDAASRPSMNGLRLKSAGLRASRWDGRSGGV